MAEELPQNVHLWTEEPTRQVSAMMDLRGNADGTPNPVDFSNSVEVPFRRLCPLVDTVTAAALLVKGESEASAR
jgi:hypothetical protein